MIIVDASRLIHQLQFEIRSDKMHKFVSSLFGFSAVVIFILQLHVNGVCATTTHKSIEQTTHYETVLSVHVTLLRSEERETVHGHVSCQLMHRAPFEDVNPHFIIKDHMNWDVTSEWYRHDSLRFYKCTTEVVLQ
ncbi:uncharacterized protein LOC120353667 isoform X2 [Nilaparvata lugens]|uniref:uncharacterized protein LOC120353667 isoform X2 n=1 Tax=Nilaparvata lugens TaxID=108931 RepID=UPI00193CC45B|nr:uncharacterized protein LOC120353667 isoform X2 [Nilaparvata lugens]